jgi:hypothetical protein
LVISLPLHRSNVASPQHGWRCFRQRTSLQGASTTPPSDLASDDTPFDKVLAGGPSLTPEQAVGICLFFGKGKCATCHGGTANLPQVVALCNRGGNFAVLNRPDLDGDTQQLGRTVHRTPRGATNRH